MNKEEADVKKFMIEQFVPALRRVLWENEREVGLMARHYGNCCNQTALLSCMHLSKVLPDYHWEMYEGIFRMVSKQGEILLFNHAWVYGFAMNMNNKSLFLNLAEDGERITWEAVTDNVYPYRCRHRWYAQEVLSRRRQVDWLRLSRVSEGEYYTGFATKSLYQIVMQETKFPTYLDMTWYAKLVQERADILKKRGFEL